MAADTKLPRFTNRLGREKSPYLLQHQHNPVDWFPWGPEAWARAQDENKPVFLSVGYSACHWCHVMERESFENEAIAQILNQHFVSIKVDREERPDVDEVYMTAVQMLTRHGGWPMSVFLTPDGRPFYGGTYFPPDDHHGRVGFASLLRQLAAAYTERRDEIEQVATRLAEDLQQATRQRPVSGPPEAPDPQAFLRAAVAHLHEQFDATHGGFGGAPKFPPHHSLRLLLEAVRREPDAAPSAPSPQTLLATTLDNMAWGGIYDHLGGGFHRYSTNAQWLLPHFEKMLYDNALLARVYADAFGATSRSAYARIARETCDWVLRDMTDAGGAFHAALDADSEGEEGKFYVWTLDEVNDVLGPDQGAAFAARYNLRPGGNFHDEATGRLSGTNIPHLSGPDLPDTVDPVFVEARAQLLARRDERVPPGKDDKVITAWNGLMIGALAWAGKTLDEPRYVQAARNAADFCLTTLCPEGKLLRIYRNGQVGLDGFLDDHAFLADGLLDLHDATGEARWLGAARGLADTLLRDFWDDEDGGFFFTGKQHEALIAASKDLFDGALPSPNGVAVRVLVRLGALAHGERFQTKAGEMLRAFGGVISRVPHATQTLVLAVLDLPAQGVKSDPVTLAAEALMVRVAPGQGATANFVLNIAPGWHVNAHRVPEDYLLPTIATISSDLPASVGPVAYPDPVAWQAGGADLPTYQGESRFVIPFTVAAQAVPGRYTLALRIRFQPCSETECLPPDERSATVTVEVPGA